MKKILIISLILISLSLVGLKASWTMPSSNSPININDGYNDQIEFAATDQYIVYTEYGDNTFSLYLYTILTGEKQLLAEQTGDKFSPSIDGTDIVWQAIGSGGKKYINHYNILTEESGAYFMPTTSYHDTHPYIQGNKISFIRWNLNAGTSYVMVYDIASASLSTIDGVSHGSQTNQRHYSNTVVWQDKRNDIDEIFIKQTIDEEEVVSNLSNNGLNHYFPKISDNNVIWDTKNSVYVKNLEDQSLQIIGSKSYANFYSSIDGNNVVYQSQRNGSYNIYLYNLKTKSEIRLTNSYQNDESPSIRGNIVTWRRQNDNGRYDVHYTNIKPALEKIYTELSFSPITTTDVLITWPEYDDGNYVNATLYRSNTYTDKGMLIGDHLTNYTYTDTNLIPGNNYYYTLTLTDKNGNESNNSEQFRYTAANKKLVKLVNSPTVYLIDEDSSYIIASEEMFNAYKFNWADIITITQRELDTYHYSGALKYPSGTLIKANHNSVYLIYGDIARPFANEEIFIRAGYKWNQIKQVTQLEFNTYEIGEELTLDNFIHPDDTLIKYTYNPDVYLIENNTKRLIIDEYNFNRHGFNWSDILTIPVYWEYPTGPNL
ncbi:MAG: hypothetical protein ACKKL6_03615 [Candidatus Komeilibacteria bacterium]